MVRAALMLVVVSIAIAASGCGDKHQAAKQQEVVTTVQATVVPPQAAKPPPSVPQTGHGPADATSGRVIRAWVAALRKGDIHKAARYFAQPSKVQNGTAVLTLDSRVARIGFNATFPCGAKVKRLRAAAHGFTVVDFILTERRGGDCMGAAGQSARSAIRVKGHRIAEWYRLDDGGGSPSPAQPSAIDPGPGIA
jgi:limonene-1,2-epoxide hydrolase